MEKLCNFQWIVYKKKVVCDRNCKQLWFWLMTSWRMKLFVFVCWLWKGTFKLETHLIWGRACRHVALHEQVAIERCVVVICLTFILKKFHLFISLSYVNFPLFSVYSFYFVDVVVVIGILAVSHLKTNAWCYAKQGWKAEILKCQIFSSIEEELFSSTW